MKCPELCFDLQDMAYQDIEGMYKQLNEELLKLQHQLKGLQGSPSHVTITHHHQTTPPKPDPTDKVSKGAKKLEDYDLFVPLLHILIG